MNTLATQPVILFLHGGSGNVNIVLLHSLVPKLEEYAIVVNMDHGGGGIIERLESRTEY